MKRSWRQATANESDSGEPNYPTESRFEMSPHKDQGERRPSSGSSQHHMTKRSIAFQRDSAIIQESIPTISRRVRACATCRKTKIRCIMPNDEPPCQRCVQRDLPCVVKKSLQTLLDDTRQYQALQNDVVNLHSTLADVCQRLNIAAPPRIKSRGERPSVQTTNAESEHSREEDDEGDGAEESPPLSPSDIQAPIDAFLESNNAKVDSPGRLVAESPHDSVSSKKNTSEPDIISKGIVSLNVAEGLVNRYLQRFDHFIYGIGSSYSDLKSLRRTAPILFTAICTVSALHDESDAQLYQGLNQELLRLISKSLFEKRGVEYLRALCIGAFWLSDASRILNSDALRRAADVRLPKYFYQLTMADSSTAPKIGNVSAAAKVDRIRIWYLHYICDQHLSILYNRDPIIHEDLDIILGWESYLESGHTNDSDIRIASQVALLSTMSQIRAVFGSSETAEPLPKALTTTFSNYNKQIDQWFARFSPCFKLHDKIGDFPHKGLKLHYHFAKLYLGHHVFRGLNAGQVPLYFVSAALTAHAAAISIFEFLLNDNSLLEALVGVPFYFHVMISFAGHFLFSCCGYSEQLSIDITSSLNLVGQAISLFRSIPCIPQHPLSKMTSALERRLIECQNFISGAATATNKDPVASMTLSEPHRDTSYWNNDRTSLQRTSFGIQNDDSNLSQAPPLMELQAANSYDADRGFAMMPPPSNSSLGLVFQDFGEFDFPDMRVNFGP